MNTARGPYVQTVTGGHWYPFSPRVEDVRFPDLQALSRITRYGGHTAPEVDFYSVAEHAVRVAWLVRDLGGSAFECLAALHHDSHEAYPPGDQLGPFLRAMRASPEFAGLLAVEAHAKAVVRRALAVEMVFADEKSAALIKLADLTLLATERRDLMAASSVDWGAMPEPMPNRIVPRDAARAWHLFQRAHRAWSNNDATRRAAQ